MITTFAEDSSTILDSSLQQPLVSLSDKNLINDPIDWQLY